MHALPNLGRSVLLVVGISDDHSAANRDELVVVDAPHLGGRWPKPHLGNRVAVNSVLDADGTTSRLAATPLTSSSTAPRN